MSYDPSNRTEVEIACLQSEVKRINEHLFGQKPEPEKWVACGKNFRTGDVFDVCSLIKGHLGPCGHMAVKEPTPTCVHCGKDPNVKSDEDKEFEAYLSFLKASGFCDLQSLRLAWGSALNFSRKEGLK